MTRSRSIRFGLPFFASQVLLLYALVGCSQAQTSASAEGGAPQGGSSAAAGGQTLSGGGAGASAGAAGVTGSAGSLAAAGMPSGGAAGAAGQAGTGGQIPMPPAPPAAYITTDDLKQSLSGATLSLGATQADATVTLDPSTTYQVMNGFGASITDASSYVMTKYLSADALHQALVKLFDVKDGAGIDFLRQQMGASDFSSVGDYSYDDNKSNDGPPDPTLANFSIAQDMGATIPVLKQALTINPAIYLMATPWSPPAWMKLNHSMRGSGGAGGNPGLNATYYDAFAQYFVKFVQAYAAAGITISAVTPQNEPQNGSAAYPGMDFDAASELKFIGQNLGPAFKSASLSTLIWAFDHNWNNENYPEQVLQDATAASFTEGAAFHCYGGDPSAMSTFHRNFPKTSIYMTECSGGDWQDDPFSNTIELEINSTANWAQAISLWNMALDENDGPTNNGCPTCRGVITVNSKSGNVTYTADYYALSHFSKFVRKGARRISSNSSNGDFNQVAFKNEDGRLAVIGHNTGNKTLTVQIGEGASAMNVSVPANAAVTVAWTPGPSQ